MPNVIDTKYHNNIISDQSPVTCTLNIKNATRPQHIWRLNPLLLGETVQISSNFDVNDNWETKPATIGEAFKAYLRDAIISFE